jgi:hypothetical protein
MEDLTKEGDEEEGCRKARAPESAYCEGVLRCVVFILYSRKKNEEKRG